MPATETSIELTRRSREQLQAERARVLAAIAATWSVIDDEDLDGSYSRWIGAAVALLVASQQTGVTYSNAYLRAFVASEIGRQVAELADPTSFAGIDRFGRPLARALAPPLATIKMAIAGGVAAQLAVGYGLQRALRIGADAAGAAPRAALASLMRRVDEVTGWRRVAMLPACGACLGDTTGRVISTGQQMRIHVNCDCVAEPVVRGSRDRVQHPTGTELFYSLSRAEQDALFEGRGGEAKADLLRSGAIGLEDLIKPDPRVLGQDGITEAPLAELTR